MVDEKIKTVWLAAEQLIGEGPAVLVVHGPPGIGKFRLAYRAAHDLLTALGSGPPLELRMNSWEAGGARYNFLELLRELRTPVHRPWDQTDSRLKDIYRETTSRRPTVLLLDEINEWSEVKEFQPGGRQSLIIASALEPLPDKKVTDLQREGLHRVHQLAVTGPDPDQSRRIFMEAAHREPVSEQEKEGVRRLIAECDNRPLALKLAAGIYNRNRRWTAHDVAEHVRRMPDEDITDRLLGWVYDHMPVDERRLLELISLSTRSTVTAQSGVAVQSLRGRGLPAGRTDDVTTPTALTGAQGLTALAQWGLLETMTEPGHEPPSEPGRFRLSPSVQRFTHHRLARNEEHVAPQSQSLPEAFRRFVATIPALPWLHLEKGSIDQILKRHQEQEDDAQATTVVAADLCDHLVQERQEIVLTMLQYVVEQFRDDVRAQLDPPVHGALGVLDRKSGQLSSAKHRLQWVRDRYAEYAQQQAGRGEAALGYTLLEARTLRHAGVAYYHAGELPTAVCYLQRAADLVPEQDSRRERPWVLRVLGSAYCDLGRLDASRGVLETAVQLHEDALNPVGAAWARTFLATSLLLSADLDGARRELDAARLGFEEHTDDPSYGRAWLHLVHGRQLWQSGQRAQALALLRVSRAMSEKLGEPLGSGWAGLELGRRERISGCPGEADTTLRSVRDVFTRMGNRLGLAWITYEQALLPASERVRSALLEEAAAEFELCGEERASALARRQLDRLARGVAVDEDDDGIPFPDPGPLPACYLVVHRLRREPGTDGVSLRVTVHLELEVQRALRAGPHRMCRVVAMGGHGMVEPGAQSLDVTGTTWPVQVDFLVKATERGPHSLRFLVLNEAAGTLLQEVEITLDAEDLQYPQEMSRAHADL